MAPTITPTRCARVKDIYYCLQAQAFEMPRTLREGGCHAHLYPQGEGRTQAIARAVRSVIHSGAPPEIAETAYNVLMDAFPFGGSKRSLSGRSVCTCGRHEETVSTLFHTCVRTHRLVEMVLDRWRTCTGETRLKGTDPRVVLFGDRSSTWLAGRGRGS